MRMQRRDSVSGVGSDLGGFTLRVTGEAAPGTQDLPDASQEGAAAPCAKPARSARLSASGLRRPESRLPGQGASQGTSSRPGKPCLRVWVNVPSRSSGRPLLPRRPQALGTASYPTSESLLHPGQPLPTPGGTETPRLAQDPRHKPSLLCRSEPCQGGRAAEHTLPPQ